MRRYKAVNVGRGSDTRNKVKWEERRPIGASKVCDSANSSALDSLALETLTVRIQHVWSRVRLRTMRWLYGVLGSRFQSHHRSTAQACPLHDSSGCGISRQVHGRWFPLLRCYRVWVAEGFVGPTCAGLNLYRTLPTGLQKTGTES